jgi:hypothetical protein
MANPAWDEIFPSPSMPTGQIFFLYSPPQACTGIDGVPIPTTSSLSVNYKTKEE